MRVRTWWHRYWRGHAQEVIWIAVPEADVESELTLCSCAQVWCV